MVRRGSGRSQWLIGERSSRGLEVETQEPWLCSLSTCDLGRIGFSDAAAPPRKTGGRSATGSPAVGVQSASSRSPHCEAAALCALVAELFELVEGCEQLFARGS